jgi:hypothetical protein
VSRAVGFLRIYRIERIVRPSRHQKVIPMSTKGPLRTDPVARFERTGTSMIVEGKASELLGRVTQIEAFSFDSGWLKFGGAQSAAKPKTKATARAFKTEHTISRPLFLRAAGGARITITIRGKSLPGEPSLRLRKRAEKIQSPVEMLDEQFIEDVVAVAHSDIGEVTVRFQRSAPAMDDPGTLVSPPTSLQAWAESVAPNAEAALAANAQRLAERRRQILKDCATIEPSTLAGSLGSTAKEPRPFLQRQRDEGKVLATKAGQGFCYPAFQLDAAGNVAPIVLALLRHARAIGWPAHGDMQLLLWLYSAEPELQGTRPLDRLLSDPQRVEEAFLARFQPSRAEEAE